MTPIELTPDEARLRLISRTEVKLLERRLRVLYSRILVARMQGTKKGGKAAYTEATWLEARRGDLQAYLDGAVTYAEADARTVKRLTGNTPAELQEMRAAAEAEAENPLERYDPAEAA